MPNVIKSATTVSTGTIQKNNFLIGVSTSVDYGPTSTTNFWNGITPPLSGYTVYAQKSSNGPSIRVASSDDELIIIAKQYGGTNINTVYDALVYFNSNSNYMVTNIDYGNIVTSGLVLMLDAGYVPSYPKTGTTWSDLSGNINSGSLVNGPTYNSDNGGSIVFDGVDDYITLGNPSSLDILNFTICAWAKSNTFSNYQNIIFKGTNVGQYGIILNSVGDWTVQPNSGQGSTFIGDIISLNTWNFFVGTYNGTQITAYRNGIQKQQYNNPQSNYGNIVTIGTDVVNNRPFNGSIPVVQIYNRALSSQEILQNYNALKSRFNL